MRIRAEADPLKLNELNDMLDLAEPLGDPFDWLLIWGETFVYVD